MAADVATWDMAIWSTAAFLLVIGRPGGDSDAGDDPSASDLGFVATHQATWQDRSGAIQLHVWQACEGELPTAWETENGSISFLTGHLLASVTRSDGDDSLSSLIGTLHGQDIRGIGAALQLHADGNGWVTADPLGLRCVYVAEVGSTVLISSRAALIATHQMLGSARNRRDLTGPCWLAYTGYWVGSRSGWAGVRVLAPGRSLLLERGRPSWRRRDALTTTDTTTGRPSIEEAAGVVLDDVASSLRSVLDQEDETPVIRLTGGKDSRLVLAAALHAGLEGDFVYETIGYPGLADADIAVELAERLGLAHELRFIGLRPDEPYADRFERFVTATGGMVNGWALDSPNNAERVVVTGICGEVLRAYGRLPERRSPEAAIAAAFDAGRFNRLGIVRPHVAAQLQASLLETVANEPSPDDEVHLRYHAHFAHHRMRFVRLGPREELTADRRAQPLYSATTVGAAMALSAQDRESELLFAEAMRQSSETLLEHRFAGRGWDERARRHLGWDPPSNSAGPDIPARPHPAPSVGASLMATVGAKPDADRIDTLHERFAQAHHQVWDLLDRTRAIAALARFPTLTGPERTELFGAATAATWLAP